MAAIDNVVNAVSSAGLSVQLSSIVTPKKEDSEPTTDILVSVQAPSMGTRPPSDICCVVDVSGSMGIECTNGDSESQGLSVLSVVKHACKTVVHSLTDQDRFTLVKYSTHAEVVFSLRKMDAQGIIAADAAIDALEENGQTNLWDGLLKGLQAVDDESGRMKAVLLLTDGQPNIVPPRGTVPMFQAYKESNETVCTVSTFGFGYNLNSALLESIAREGQGMYAFIPDGSFVGTAFVNATSNILSTAARQVVAKVSNITDFEKDLSKVTTPGVGHTKSTWGLQVELGAVMFGQTKDFVVQVPTELIGASFRVDVDYSESGNLEKQTTFSEGIQETNDTEALVQGLRLRCVELMRTFYPKDGTNLRSYLAEDSDPNTLKLNTKNLDEMLVHAKSLSGNVKDGDERVADLVKDLDGQIREAMSRPEYYKKWGVHYLPSLAIAHALQQCHNFKDPGVQHYGGPLFTALRETAEQTFTTLPPPTPPKPKYTNYGGYGGAGRAAAAPTRAPVDMSAYYNRGGGCFTASTMVTMADGITLKRVDQLQTGDIIQTFRKDADRLAVGTGAVKFVTEMQLASPALLVTLPGGLEITAWHPVLVENSWIFPATIAQQVACNKGTRLARYHDLSSVSSVFNLALEEEGNEKWHGALMNGVPTITLGHGIENDPVASHDYYGTQAVIADMESLGRNSFGRVIVPPPTDQEAPVVDTIKPTPQITSLALCFF